AHIEQRWRAFWIPAMLVSAHPLNPDRLTDGARQERGIARGVFMGVAPIATRAIDIDTANVLVHDAQHRSQLLAQSMCRLRGGPAREFALLELSYRARGT